MAETLRLGRTATHLGMVPLVRMPELSRTQVQRLLDGGIQVLALPDVRTAEEAARFVQMGKYPPVGRRGVSSSSAGTAYTMGADPKQTLREVNEATHLMLMIESDEAYESLDEILAVDGIDMVTVGPMDWSVSLGLFGDEAQDAPDAEIRAGLYSCGRVRQDCFGWSFQLRPGRALLFLGCTCLLRGRRHCDQTPVSDRYAQSISECFGRRLNRQRPRKELVDRDDSSWRNRRRTVPKELISTAPSVAKQLPVRCTYSGPLSIERGDR